MERSSEVILVQPLPALLDLHENEQLATLVRLQAEIIRQGSALSAHNTRHLSLSRDEVSRLTGRKRRDHAMRALAALERRDLLSVSTDDDIIHVEVAQEVVGVGSP